MITSESIAKISAALVQAQKEITFASADSNNPHYRSKYADLGSVIEACKKPLNDHGIAIIQLPTEAPPGHLALTTRLQHDSGEWVQSTAVVPLPKNDPQGYGSAMTYTRRYSLAAAVGLYQEDDDGNKASKPKPAITPASGIYDSLAEARRRACDAAAEAVMNQMNVYGIEDATAMWKTEKAELTVDEQVAAWSLIDSKTRSAIKKQATNGGQNVVSQ